MGAEGRGPIQLEDRAASAGVSTGPSPSPAVPPGRVVQHPRAAPWDASVFRSGIEFWRLRVAFRPQEARAELVPFPPPVTFQALPHTFNGPFPSFKNEVSERAGGDETNNMTEETSISSLCVHWTGPCGASEQDAPNH